MIIHSFFLDLTKVNDLNLPFLEEKSFCLKDNYDGIHPVLKDFGGPHQILYAMTTSKRIKELFMMTRNMNFFKYYKTDVSKSKAASMLSTLSEMVLHERTLFDSDSSTEGEKIVNLVLSDFEYNRVRDELILLMHLEEVFDDITFLQVSEYNILNRNFRNLLNELLFDNFVDLLSFGKGANDADFEYVSDEFYDILSEISTKAKFKTFEIFIREFGNIMKC